MGWGKSNRALRCLTSTGSCVHLQNTECIRGTTSESAEMGPHAQGLTVLRGQRRTDQGVPKNCDAGTSGDP
jgi:hypothetical protein